MLVKCECGARYQYDERRFQGASERKVRCPKCKRVFTIQNPELFRTKMHEEMVESGVKVLETPRFSLAIRRGGVPGKTFLLDRPKTTIGRVGADIDIDDPEASRIHAELEIAGSDLILRDLGSTNGTRFQGEKVTSMVLEDEAEFQIGQTYITVHKVLLSFD